MRSKGEPYVPSLPLAEAVLRIAAECTLRVTCRRAGVPERVVTRWRLGEQGGLVHLDLADQVMTSLGLCWWDIWTEKTVREPMFMVTTYHHQWKKEQDRGHRLRRIKDRTIPYGDLGTDFYRLREIESLMSGSLEVAA